ncbi:unnamed protein product [Blepharisma stoltei]|uniref:Uncharacterized protein n=1 Tax=Blepharisma stoltei TaxID=1481888 RepID=A0AAU9J2N6_9CILI|nr:unnamed protein product [Blepharisma stoltei]
MRWLHLLLEDLWGINQKKLHQIKGQWKNTYNTLRRFVINREITYARYKIRIILTSMHRDRIGHWIIKFTM